MDTVFTTITVNGAALPLPAPSFVEINSVFNGHHAFSLGIEVSAFHYTDIATLRMVAGADIEIQFQKEHSTESPGIFHGVVDSMKVSYGDKDEEPVLVIKGYSRTVNLDYAPVFRCFAKTTLQKVANDILGEYKHLFPAVNINVGQDDEPVIWAIQQQETDADFLKRKINDSAHLEMWFDGACLHVANLTEEKGNPIYLEHGKELFDLDISLDTAPLEFTMTGYDFAAGKSQYAKAAKLKSANPFIDIAINNSPYPAKDLTMDHGIDESIDIEKIVRKIAGTQAHTLHTIDGESTVTELKIGSQIKIYMKDGFLEHEIEEEQYVITSIKHTIDHLGNYRNFFTALPISLPYNVPMINGKRLVSGPKAAIVADTNDPDGLGRVRVMYIGDTNKAISPLLRVLTLSTSNGGVVAMPKRNEEVLVFSESLNLEHTAFVMGSFRIKGQNTGKCKDPDKMMGWFSENIGVWFDERDKSFNIDATKVKIKAGKLILDGTDQGTFINCDES